MQRRDPGLPAGSSLMEALVAAYAALAQQLWSFLTRRLLGRYHRDRVLRDPGGR